MTPGFPETRMITEVPPHNSLSTNLITADQHDSKIAGSPRTDKAVDELTYPILSGLARTGPPCSAADLAPDVGLNRSGVTRRASRLEAAGLVRREPDPADGRATLLTLTAEGESAVETLRRRLADHITAGLASWPGGEVAAFAVHLRSFVTDGPFA
jgi:DNA-binding MarR family transcriptional regulator